MKREPLTEMEKKCRAALRTMARRKEPFSYRRVSDHCGWKSVNAAYEAIESLERKGYVARGKRLALVECPVEVVPLKKAHARHLAEHQKLLSEAA